jgi:hypothetical protein
MGLTLVAASAHPFLGGPEVVGSILAYGTTLSLEVRKDNRLCRSEVKWVKMVNGSCGHRLAPEFLSRKGNRGSCRDVAM